MPRAPCLFVSDLHLDAALPAAVSQFIGFLQGPARQAAALYIVGDLFESWVGDDDLDFTRERVCAALRELTTSGVPCFVLRGNRDFLLGEDFARRANVHLLPDPVLVEFGQVKLCLLHGDLLCTDDHAYQSLRTVVRDPLWQQRFLALDLPTRRALAGAARRGSKAHIDRAMQQIMDVNPAAVITAFRATGTRLMVHGHTHRPATHTHVVDGDAAIRIVLGDWYTQGSCLRLEPDGRYELMALSRSDNAASAAR